MSKIFLEEKTGWRSAHYFARIQVRGERRKFRLESTVKEDAARQAATLYTRILAEGWPTPVESKEEIGQETECIAEDRETTLGEWIEFAGARLGVRPQSVAAYTDSLRTVASEILALDDVPKLKKKEIVLNSSVGILSKINIQQWIEARLRKARALDQIQSRRAQNTIRTLVGNAKCLFPPHLLEAGDVPAISVTPLPFHEVKLPPKQVARYSSRFDPDTLLARARTELSFIPEDESGDEAVLRYEQWKILYLALVAGMRYSEIDRLRIRDISVKAGKIAIRAHEEFRPKTLASEAEVQVGREAMEIITEMMKHSEDGWFLKACSSRKFRNYRAGLSHDRLVAWLRAYRENGEAPFGEVSKPIHELRKEAGTLVNGKYGLAAAKVFLRHSSIATTAGYYVDTKGDITTGLA